LQNASRRKLYGLFFLSGAVALVYQVVWTRILTLFFGSTILAVSTVLAVFMAGLAIGSALFGRKADQTAEPVRFYGRLELIIGILAMATPLIFTLIEKSYLFIHQSTAPGPWQAAMIRFGLSSLLLLPPTIMMGGTLPVLSKVFLKGNGSNTGRSISILYFINTFGAVIGTVAAGMFLLQLLGIRWVLILGGLVNIGIFLVAYRMPLLRMMVPEEEPSVPSAGGIAGSRWSRNAVLAVVTLFFSGMAALIYEVAWTRVLTLVIGSSTYAFTIMLATFLTGIAIGSALIGRYSVDRKPGTGLLAVCQILIGVFAVGTAAIFGVLPDAFVSLFGAVGQKFGWFLAGNFLLCFLVMVPATVFMGASFPVASALVVESFGSSGRRIGLLYAGNTVGAILGAFLAGFVFLPKMGIQNTLILTVFVNLVCGLLLSLFAFSGESGIRRIFAPAVAASLILFLAFAWRPSWDTLKMTSGPYAYAVQYQKIPIEQRLSRMEQLFYREGPIATVSVVKEGKHIRLVVDGKTDAGNYRDMTTQVLAGHLPLLVKPEAKDVLVIGYASGITAGAVARHDVKRIDCVEIEPAMRDASRFFDEENYRVIDDRRFNLVIDDARSFVLGARKKYDVVISEPSNPWQAGSSRLFTREAFLNARNSLKDDGVMAQWMHLYGVDVETFRLVVRTFHSVFPHVTLWMDPDFADVIFLGSSGPIKIDPVAMNRLFKENPRVSASLARIGYPEAWSIFRAFVLTEEDAKRFAKTGELNTDNLPHLEYRAPKSLYSNTALQENVRALLETKSPESFPATAVDRKDAIEAASLLKEWGKSLAESKSTANARGAFSNAAMLNPSDDQTHFYLALLRMQSGDQSGAIKSFERATGLNPRLGGAYVNMGTLYLQAGDTEKAYIHLKKAASLGEDSSGLRNNLAVILAKSGKFEDAIREGKRAVALDPNNRTARENLEKFERLSKGK
jgi:spermidine synthase